MRNVTVKNMFLNSRRLHCRRLVFTFLVYNICLVERIFFQNDLVITKLIKNIHR